MIYSYRLRKSRHDYRRQENDFTASRSCARRGGTCEAEGKTLSVVIQDALRQARIERRLQELRGIQGYWSRKARDKGILTERDLERYISR